MLLAGLLFRFGAAVRVGARLAQRGVRFDAAFRSHVVVDGATRVGARRRRRRRLVVLDRLQRLLLRYCLSTRKSHRT